MTDVYLYTFGAVLLVSLVSLVGIFAISINQRLLRVMIFFLVSLSAGALFGDAIIHLIPESFENLSNSLLVSLLIVGGILIFFVLEKFLHWHHSHGESVDQDHCEPEEECVHPTGWMILISDGVHNFLDGMIIAGSFLIDIKIGIATTIAVFLHEIPQEIGDFGVLIHSGFKRGKALLYNFMSAILAVIGAALVLVLGASFAEISNYIIPISAGGFLYIAGSDLIPELHKTVDAKKSFIQFIALIIGIALMALLILVE